jgi:hypothetical protein
VSFIDRLSVDVKLRAAIVPTPRAMQTQGLFDIPPANSSEVEFKLDHPLPLAWNIGLICGPSGSGKTTIANAAWPGRSIQQFDWHNDKAIVDGFPEKMGIKEVTALLSSVGFSSPPAWLKPYRVLSNGEKFRVDMARVLAENPDIAVVDEFTSFVDRDVAKVASAAVAKAVRRSGRRLVAVSCHYDIAEWLEPDWSLDLFTGQYVSGRSLRRPKVDLTIRRVRPSCWHLFEGHHYLRRTLHEASCCFVAYVWDRPAAFCAVISNPHPRNPGWREHRVVCLPEFQGIGIGSTLGDYVGSLYAATGRPYSSTLSHPGLIAHRRRSPLWKPRRKPGMASGGCASSDPGLMKTASTERITWSFMFVGPANRDDARKFGLV